VIGADSATLVEPIRRGRPIQILLHVIGQPDRVVSFDPPDLTPPTASIAAAASGAAVATPAVTPAAPAPHASLTGTFATRLVAERSWPFAVPSDNDLYS
jgi:hypothetical protein